jgi:hypothetical protein
MKQKLTTLLFTSVLAASALITPRSALGQTNSIAGGLTEIWDAIESSGLATATNYAVEPYLTYAQNAPSGNKVGGGAFIAYNVSKYLGTGLGVDYLGQFSLVSADVQLKVPTQPFTWTGISWLTNVTLAPFALAGVGTPLSGTGSSGGAIAVTDAGAYVEFGHLWGGRFNVGGAYGEWENAGAYSGPREHVFIGWSKGF